MNYTGKICDGCREPFEDGDDIVVCPVCGTPQHRSCYEKNHHCVNEYLHSPDFTWTCPEDEKKEEEPMAAQPVQEEQSQTSPFIRETPEDMESVFMRGVLYDPKDDIGGGAKVGEAADYLQNAAPRYISKFMKQKKSGRKLSWNWAAFLFTPYWFFYRKLYKAGALFLAISIALSLVTYSPSMKVIDAYNQMADIQQERLDMTKGKDKLSEEDLIKYEDLGKKEVSLFKSVLPALAVLVLIQRIIPGAAAALVANYLLKKRMLRVISLAHDATEGIAIVKYTIMRNGGVSVMMPIIAIFIDNYLPSLLLNIAYKINF